MWAMGKWIIDSVISGFGAANATGGTSSAGNVMSKLNKLLTDWTTTRAGYIDTINSNIGATNNTGGTASAGTVMGKLNAIVTSSASASSSASSANTNAANAYSVLTNSTYGLSAIKAKLPSSWQMGVVKSVQRGTHYGAKNDITITISSVDPAKCHVSIYPSVSAASYPTSPDSYTYTPMVEELTATTLKVSASMYSRNNDTPLKFSWEIVEYY